MYERGTCLFGHYTYINYEQTMDATSHFMFDVADVDIICEVCHSYFLRPIRIIIQLVAVKC